MKRTIRPTDIRPDPRREVSDEIRFHLDERAREFEAQGLAPDAARRAALASFGDVAGIASELTIERGGRDRERARRAWWRGTVLDVRHACRSLLKHPVFAAATVLTLALGIGASVAIFTVVNGVLLRPLPYAEPGRLALIWMRGDGVRANERWPFSSGFFLDLRAQSRSFASMAAFRSWPMTLNEGELPERFEGARVSPELFELMGVRPLLGRTFTEADAAPGAAPIALIGEGLWRRVFGASPEVIGRMVTLNGRRTMIAGVLPARFTFPRGAELPAGLQFGSRTDVWAPLAFTEEDARNYGTQNLAVIGRLRDGLSLEAAERDLDGLLQTLLAELGFRQKIGIETVSIRDQATQQVARGLVIVSAAVALLLLIAGFNVANLLLARTAERARELALRSALGARRARVAWQLMTENLLLSLLGGTVGAALSWWCVRALLALVPGTLPRADDVRVDWWVLGVAVVLSVVCGVAFGVMTAAAAGKANLVGALAAGTVKASTGPQARRARRLLVTTQVALSLVLLVAGGLLVRSFLRLESVDPGFDPDGVVTAGVLLPVGERFNLERDGPGWGRFFEQLQQRVAALPGVEAAGAVSALPLSGAVESGGFRIAGREPADPSAPPDVAQYSIVHGDYFRAAGIGLVQGRVFDARDNAEGPLTIVVSESFAKKYFPGENAVGKRLLTGFTFTPGAREIIGVVGDVKLTSLADETVPAVYVPELQMPYPFLSLVVRTRSPEAVLAGIRSELKTLDGSLALSDVRAFRDVYDESLSRQRFSLVLIVAFAAAALCLSGLGLYGVIALGVHQRQRELGVRLALGAHPRDVRRLVLREGLAMTAAGVALGLLLAVAFSGSLGDLLYRTSPTDPGVLGVAVLFVGAMALGASYVPAVRATRVQPTEALRGD
jgi:predicted permease